MFTSNLKRGNDRSSNWDRPEKEGAAAAKAANPTRRRAAASFMVSELNCNSQKCLRNRGVGGKMSTQTNKRTKRNTKPTINSEQVSCGAVVGAVGGGQ